MMQEQWLRANFLHRFDTDGAPIVLGQTTLTYSGTVPKEYQAPYGATTVSRHVYQSSRVREDVLPALYGMHELSRLATPRLAMQLPLQVCLMKCLSRDIGPEKEP